MNAVFRVRIHTVLSVPLALTAPCVRWRKSYLVRLMGGRLLVQIQPGQPTREVVMDFFVWCALAGLAIIGLVFGGLILAGAWLLLKETRGLW